MFGCPNIFTDRRSASLWSFLVKDTSVSGGCRKLNCRRSDLWGRTVRLLRRPNFTTEDSNFHVLTCGRFGQVVRTVSRPLTGLIRDIFFSECSGYSFPHRVFICSNVLLNYLTKYTQHSWNLMLQRKIFHYFMQYLFKFNLYQFYIYNRKNLNYQKDSKINQKLTWNNLWCLLPIKKVNGYTISDNTNHQHLLYGRGVSAPIILVVHTQEPIAQNWLINRNCADVTRKKNSHACFIVIS